MEMSASVFWRYGLAVLFTALALVVRTMAQPILLDHPGALIFTLAVLASAYCGGIGPSLLAGLLSGLAVAYFWIDPRYMLELNAYEWIELALFLVTAVAIGGVTEMLQSARRRAAAEMRRALESQDALRESEARFTDFMKHLPGAAWMTRPDGRVVYMNPAGLHLLNTTAEELYGRALAQTRKPGRFPEHLMAMHDLAVAENVMHRIEAIERDDGKSYYMISKFPIVDGQGKPILLAGLAFDVTDRERATAALRAEWAFRRAVEESVPAGIVAVDLDGTQNYASPAFCRMVGWDAQELVGRKRPFPYWPAEEVGRITAVLDRIMRGQMNPNGYELRLCRRDGSRFDALMLGAMLHGEDGKPVGWVASVTDVTARKHAQRQLQTLTETLEQRVAERTAVAERRARQLRLLSSELVQTERRERRRLAQSLHDHLQQLLVAAKMQIAAVAKRLEASDTRDAIHHAERLLGEAIHASRTLTFELSPPVLEHGLAAALQWLARSKLEKYHLNVELRLDRDAEPDEDVRAFLFEAVRELLFNVTKHAGVNKACVEMRRVDHSVELTVTDEGAGFDPTHREGGDTSGEHFGLFSIKERLEVIGGSMTIVTKPGQGTRITLTAPLVSPADGKDGPAGSSARRPITDAARPQPVAPSIVRRSLRNRRTRVLLVDDHAIVRDGLISVLRQQRDMKVVGEAADGHEAVAMTRELQPDVVVMDVSMPGMNGVEATQRITAEAPNVRVIGLSMHEQRDMAQAMRQAGAWGYLAKDGPCEALLAAIRGESNAAR